MEITKLEKQISMVKNSVTIKVEIEIPAVDLMEFDYQGLDMIPDECIPDILLAVSRMYKIKNGKIKKIGVLK